MHPMPAAANHPSSNQEEHIQPPTTDPVATGQDSTTQVILMTHIMHCVWHALFINFIMNNDLF